MKERLHKDLVGFVEHVYTIIKIGYMLAKYAWDAC